MTLKRAFAPVVDAETRLLILGSLPGDASLAAGQYYAHPRNGFWGLMGGVVERDLVALPYPERLKALATAKIGLWDVVAGAERIGSLDTAIRAPEYADLTGLVGALPRLQAVAFNGGKAAKDGRRLLAAARDLTLIDLPSSSPAHARPLPEKAAIWMALRQYLQAAAIAPRHASFRPADRL